jgi:hypothetical protein
MTDSVKNFPIIKDKNRFMQKYLNRKERRLAKQMLEKGEYLLPEKALVPHGSYDVSDYTLCFCWGMGQWKDMEDPRTRHKLIGK